MVNKCIVQGNLVRDPELRKVGDDTSVCNFTIAMSEKFGQKESKLFLDCSAWNKQADTIYNRFKKGDNILLVGKLWTKQWTDKDGKSRKNNTLEVSEVHFTQFVDHSADRDQYGFATVDDDDDIKDMLPF